MAKSRTSVRLLVATLILLVPPMWGWWAVKGQGPLTSEATVLVKRGATLDEMANQLEKDGVVRSAGLFKLWARARKLQLIRGEYAFQPGTSMAEVTRKLKRGEVHWTNVVVVEGMHAWSLQKRLKDWVPEEIYWQLWKSPRLAKAAGFPDAPSLEGLVAPATYRLNHALEPEEVMLMLVEAFREQVRPKLDGGVLDPYDTLKLASIVERETRLPEEKAKVAGVYALRLKKGMLLQADPTSQYARWMKGDLRFTAPLHEDIVAPHPFNTYTTKGLPPTPIAIPSPASIEGALQPDIGKDLFFVATGKGGHAFGASLGQHNKNINAYRKELKRQKQALKAGR
ncbi:MAG TPA: endolytic transglycosylase MltG [Geothrix sp.]|nr:endolytic transglycosylase MltG [Geothrix sp.]